MQKISVTYVPSIGTLLKCNMNIETKRQKTKRQKDDRLMNRTQKTSRRPPMPYQDQKWWDGEGGGGGRFIKIV